MDKVMIGKMPVAAVPAVIVGTLVDGKPNYNTLGCFGMMSITKPTVSIMSGRSHYTNKGIRETGYFSVNVPTPGIVRETDYVGLVSGEKVDKSGLFTPFFGSVDKAPMIKECPVNMLCRVIKTDELPNVPNHEIFYGEIEEVYVSGDCFVDGQPDPKKINPLLLTGRSYAGIGEYAGAAWKEGLALIKR
ncbi:flavin reductase family protein [Methanocella sp. MCL-LM]|uniref:flavin reductase family protein n=1 Tax=Methanocella sp. MCL-LM TaxID=3412035 RepID=UPI003C731752